GIRGGQHGARRLEAIRQQRREITVDLDGIERAVAAFEQRRGERAAPGPDLHQMIPDPGRERARDAQDHRGVVEEVLAEALAARRPAARSDGGGGGGRGARQARHQRRCAARRLASRTAALKLRESARPLPARSSAVPWSGEVRTIGSPSVTLTARSKPACFTTGSPWS